ncbi:MAG: alpha/beta hydrolase [Rickettsiaceae bacterium]|nr:alpha/beta hydrolase [Rickettsiaceae bacterium]
MTKYLGKNIYLLLILFLVGCTPSNQSLKSSSYIPQGFKEQLVSGTDFTLTTYQKITSANAPYVFYIEGDGRVATKTGISPDPTPKRPVLINIMMLDSRPNIIYIARPCQYSKALNPKCSNNSYWTTKRFAEEVVDNINQVINKISGNKNFSLVGYSGGGGIAILIASRNQNVSDIITIGGNLDIKKFTSHHRSLPMKGSINPIDYAEKVKFVPQMHLSGELDRVVPPFIAEEYVLKSSSTCVKHKIIKGATHSRNWEEFWRHYNKQPNCN